MIGHVSEVVLYDLSIVIDWIHGTQKLKSRGFKYYFGFTVGGGNSILPSTLPLLLKVKLEVEISKMLPINVMTIDTAAIEKVEMGLFAFLSHQFKTFLVWKSLQNQMIALVEFDDFTMFLDALKVGAGGTGAAIAVRKDTVALGIDSNASASYLCSFLLGRSLYLSSTSSSSFSSSGASCSSVSSSRRSSTLLELMKGGSTSLRRLFDMEHTSLANHFENYSGSPITKAIPLWDTDTDNEHYASWTPVRQMLSVKSPGNDGGSGFASGGSFSDGEFGFLEADKRTRSRRLARTKSFRRLPGFKLRRYRGFRFRFRFRRLRIMICGQKF
ncbi:hypothetical protein RJ641_028477 [Dillenia turbinata]|uniref:Uncharacterized protein n=1 Tax=Dillenia turbinata TaxID=194707 RepID=A0AAN8VZA9_9MAGN